MVATQTQQKTTLGGTAGSSPITHRPWWQIAMQAVALTCMAVAGLELFFDLAGIGREQILQPDTQFGTIHIPSQLVVWRMEGYSQDRMSSAGLRDREHPITKPMGMFRVALLGDSATEGLQVPIQATYGARIEQILKKARGMKAEVINFGCSGYSTGQEVLQYEKQVAAYKPDLTILLYNRGDAIENTRKPTDLGCEPRPYFYLDSHGKLQQDDAVLNAHKSALAPNPVLAFLRKNSRIWGVICQTDLNLSIHESLYRKLRGWVLSPFSAHIRKLKPSEAPYPAQDAWAVTQALVERLNADCVNAHSNLLVVAFPNIVKDPEFGHQIDSLAACAKTQRFQFLDLTPSFRWHPDPMSLFLQYHFSAKGHQFVADCIAELLGTKAK